MIYVVIAVVIILVLTPVSMIIYLSVTEYIPQDVEESKIFKNSNSSKLKKTMTLTTLNIGYSSIDKDQDFFLEGGKGSRCVSKQKTSKNLKGIASMLKETGSDFYFLQEVDEPCRRSCYTNQVKYIAKIFHDYNNSFVYNYKVKHIPLPIFKPMGSAESGLLTLSKSKISESHRHRLLGKDSFPKRLFYPKRCMMINKYRMNDKQELILINIHLSAYGKGGLKREKQIKHLIEFINEISKTNKYVIIGGDWNHIFEKSKHKGKLPKWLGVLPKELFETKFRIIYDKEVNTVRSVDTPYTKGKNFETIIDGFLVSPGIEVVKINTRDFEFKYTDHNPVTISFKLK